MQYLPDRVDNFASEEKKEPSINDLRTLIDKGDKAQLESYASQLIAECVAFDETLEAMKCSSEASAAWGAKWYAENESKKLRQRIGYERCVALGVLVVLGSRNIDDFSSELQQEQSLDAKFWEEYPVSDNLVLDFVTKLKEDI